MKQADHPLYISSPCLQFEQLPLETSETSPKTPLPFGNRMFGQSSPTSVVDRIIPFDDFVDDITSKSQVQPQNPPSTETIEEPIGDSDFEMELIDTYCSDPPQLLRLTSQHSRCRRPSNPVAKFLLRAGTPSTSAHVITP
jgi:hypothetical protein